MSEPITHGPLVETLCPACSYSLTGAMVAHGDDRGPVEGDSSICLNCGQVLIYRADLTLRCPTRLEIRKLMFDRPSWAAIEKAQVAIRERGRFA